MIDRRNFAGAAGLVAASALLGSTAHAEGHAEGAAVSAVVTPPKGPWTSTGEIRRGGGVLHYAAIGDGVAGKPPIVLLHKLGGWLSDWRFVAPALAAGRTVIAFDLPGHGGSRWDGAPPYIQTLGETAALLVGALDEMGHAQVDLIGTSLGGCVAVPLAAFWPERVRRLALVSCALGGARSLAAIKAAVDAGQGKLFDAAGNPRPTTAEQLVTTFGIVHPEAINIDGNLSRRAAGHWIQPSERGVALADIKGTLPRVTAPTLLLYGEKDKAYLKFRAGAEAALAHSRTEIVPDAGAFVMQDNPPATGAILRRFVSEA
jgi:pimeloyl-ACP methyl ester carboxylesterase